MAFRADFYSSWFLSFWQVEVPFCLCSYMNVNKSGFSLQSKQELTHSVQGNGRDHLKSNILSMHTCIEWPLNTSVCLHESICTCDLSYMFKTMKTNEHFPDYPNRLSLLSHIPNYRPPSTSLHTHTQVETWAGSEHNFFDSIQ